MTGTHTLVYVPVSSISVLYQRSAMKKRRRNKKKHVVKIKKQKEMALEFVKNEKARPVFAWVFQISVVLAIAAVTAIFFFQSIIMQESSMEPTFMTGERFLSIK